MKYLIVLVLSVWVSLAQAQTDINLPPGVWSDLTSLADIEPGVPGTIQNNGRAPLRVLTSVSQTTNPLEGIIILKGPVS